MLTCLMCILSSRVGVAKSTGNLIAGHATWSYLMALAYFSSR